MPKTKQQKQEILKNLGESVGKQISLVFVGYKGMKVKDLSSLRSQLKTTGAKLQVIKKTLFEKALKEKGIELKLKALGDQIAAVFSFEDAFAPLKTLFQFAKTNEHLKVLAGFVESKLQNAETLKAIAMLPSRDELRGQLVRTIAGPMSGFMNVLQGNMKGLVRVLAQAKTS
ncbi:MAG: 50S ribosomal protein L10 [Candidatus Wildermuthbacteria bacterium]|nr:50S ribosomal protein L10 [Candidatus Wildermuthbacteria bacterium]